MSYDFLFVEQELGALQTILQDKQIKSHYMILQVEKQNYFIVLMVVSDIGALVAAWLKEKERSLGPYTSYRAKIYQSQIKRWLNQAINKYQLPTCKCTNSTSSGHKTLRSLVFFSSGYDRV